jgi:ribonuclease R
MLLRELMRSLGLPKEHRSAFQKLLNEMIRDGDLISIKGNRYGIPGKMNLMTGRLQCHPDGFGFVLSEMADESDLFIGRRHMMEAMHGDRVVARIEEVKPDGRREGRIIRVLQRGITRIVGRFEWGREFGFIVPTEKRIGRDLFVAHDEAGGAKDGDLVVAEITAYPTPHRNPEGRIVQVLGPAYDPRIDTEMVIAEFGLPKVFPDEVLLESESVPDTVSADMIRHRRDLRDLNTVTIDGERARDFDDAVSVRGEAHGRIRLWVHIADVGHYVSWDSMLDREARRRGTSVYFPDQVVPMFPERLSNGICSLNPRVDRLTLTAEMLFDSDGRRLEYDLYESVIRSNERMTYTAVKKILTDKEAELCRAYDYLLHDFEVMEDLCRRLMAVRARDGSIDFDLPEPEIILDLQGQTTDIIREERHIAHRMIEEFMLAANRTVAEHMTGLKIPFIYRIHESPDPEKIHDFIQFIGSFGLRFAGPKSGADSEKIRPKAFRNVLEQAKGRPEERLVNHVLLRSMKQAKYSTQNVGHFGLAFEDYTHFTSPIRRYPDLVVHRLVKEWLHHTGISAHRRDTLQKLLPEVAQTSSERERLAMEAEREAVDLKKVRFLADKEGEEYFGFITGVTAFGFFVELEEMFVEGLVHISSIPDDYYVYEEKQHRLMGRRHRRIFRLADRVKVRVEKVDLIKRQADFRLVEEGPARAPIPRPAARRPGRGQKGKRRRR